MKKILALLVVASIMLLLIQYAKKSGTRVQTPEQAVSITGCYVATLGKDIYTLNIASQNGTDVSGTLRFKNFEKDSSSGTFRGTYVDGILAGDYEFNSEGMDSNLQVVFKRSGNDFIRGFGEMDKTGERFASLDAIAYDSSQVFKATPCTE